jgi:hypothetical protein
MRRFGSVALALVIGNSTYQKTSKLLNPGNDAKTIARMLQAASFDEVVLYENLGIRELRQAIKDFSDLARDADIAVVYYSGHGIEVNGANYLIPTDAVLDRDIDTPYEAYSLDNLVQVLEPARRLRLVMLDACRDNPFARSMKRTIGSRAVGRGFAPVEPTSVNTLIGFAAKAGSIALDGEGANSPYAAALLNNLPIPGLDLRIAFGRVRDEVLKLTRNKQEPFLYGSLGGSEIALVPTKVPLVVTPPMPPRSTVDYDKEMEITFWSAVKDAKSKDLLQTYLDRYPAGNFAGLAKVLIEQLDKEQNATRLAAERNTQARVAEAARIAAEAKQADAARAEQQRLAKLAAEAAASQKTTTASLPPGELAPAVAKPADDHPQADQKLARALQTELKRVGCDPGELDGVWGAKAKDALANFARLVKKTLPSDSPTSEALQAVLGQKGRICPLAAGKGRPNALSFSWTIWSNGTMLNETRRAQTRYGTLTCDQSTLRPSGTRRHCHWGN